MRVARGKSSSASSTAAAVVVGTMWVPCGHPTRCRSARLALGTVSPCRVLPARQRVRADTPCRAPTGLVVARPCGRPSPCSLSQYTPVAHRSHTCDIYGWGALGQSLPARACLLACTRPDALFESRPAASLIQTTFIHRPECMARPAGSQNGRDWEGRALGSFFVSSAGSTTGLCCGTGQGTTLPGGRRSASHLLHLLGRPGRQTGVRRRPGPESGWRARKSIQSDPLPLPSPARMQCTAPRHATPRPPREIKSVKLELETRQAIERVCCRSVNTHRQSPWGRPLVAKAGAGAAGRGRGAAVAAGAL